MLVGRILDLAISALIIYLLLTIFVGSGTPKIDIKALFKKGVEEIGGVVTNATEKKSSEKLEVVLTPVEMVGNYSYLELYEGKGVFVLKCPLVIEDITLECGEAEVECEVGSNICRAYRIVTSENTTVKFMAGRTVELRDIKKCTCTVNKLIIRNFKGILRIGGRNATFSGVNLVIEGFSGSIDNERIKGTCRSVRLE